MNRTSTSSFRASARSARIETVYTVCPLCGSTDIDLGKETITVSRKAGECRVNLERWACPQCGERFLTERARRKLDVALRLGVKR